MAQDGRPELDHEYAGPLGGRIPPVAKNVWLYGWPTCKSPKLAVILTDRFPPALADFMFAEDIVNVVLLFAESVTLML